MTSGFSDNFEREFERLFPGNNSLLLIVRQGGAREIKIYLEANTMGFDPELVALSLDRGESGIAKLRQEIQRYRDIKALIPEADRLASRPQESRRGRER